MLMAWALFKKPDVSMALNGALAGLVAITCPCAWVSVTSAAIIGVAAGMLVVFAVLFFDKIHVDDPVGAVSVHGVCGAFGTLALGLFSQGDAFGTTGPKAGLFFGGGMSQLIPQAIGVGTVFLWSAGTGLALFAAIKAINGLRVSAEEEMEGLDIGEHGASAYPNFVTVEHTSVTERGAAQPDVLPVPQPATVQRPVMES
jgi:Amt family ammonium transporter